MVVDGLFEMNTTYLGWHHYNNIWKLLTATGIAYLPFLALLFRNFIEPYQSLEPEDASIASVRRMEVDIALALTVVVLAAQPFILLTGGTLKYQPQCQENILSAGQTGMTYDDQFFLPDVSIPIWWYAVMAVSSGLSHAAVSTVWECNNGEPAPQGANIMASAALIRIDKPDLIQEMAQFSQDCFNPARADYREKHPDVSKYPRGDTEWPGSQAYLNLGYYDTHQAQVPIPGWPYDPNRDVMYGNPPDPRYDKKNMGRPYCKEWWTDPQRGLRKKIVDSLNEQGLVAGVRAFQESKWPDAAFPNLENDLIQRAWSNTAAQQQSVQAASDSTSLYGLDLVQNSNIAGTVLTMTGLLKEKFQFFPMMNAIKIALPMLQALILMGMYTLLPLILVSSTYHPKILLTGSIAVFTVKFWSYLWSFALSIENNLVASMYPNGTFWLSPSDNNKLSILTMVIALLYIVLPLIWSLMMAWVGVHMGGAIDNAAARLQEPAQRGGQRAGAEILNVAPSLGSAIITGSGRFIGTLQEKHQGQKRSSGH